jgi:transcription initiation factor IIE alpha subunit
VTPAQWRLSRRVLEVLAAKTALTDHQIAERLGVSAAELRPVLGMLLGRRQLERCGDYLTLVSQSPAGGDAA